MKLSILLTKLEGLHTLESVMSVLKVSKQKAIYCIYRLRKAGYVKTRRLKGKKRLYSFSIINKTKSISYEEIINKHSPVKIASFKISRMYGFNPTLEETLIYAIKTKSFRTILASISLFRKISDWKLLYHLAKENHIERQVGALYNLARNLMRVRRMDRHFLKNALPKKNYKFEYFIKNIKSKDFSDISNKWRVYLPFNKQDLEEYR